MGAWHSNNFAEFVQRSAPGSFFVEVEKPEEADDPKRTFRFKKKVKGQMVGSYNTAPLPGCCGVLVLFNFYTSGDAEDMMKCVQVGLTAAKRAGYGAVALTLKGGTLLQALSALENKTTVTFLNGKTGNQVAHILVD